MIVVDNPNIKTGEFSICRDVANHKSYRCFKMIGNYLLIFGFGKCDMRGTDWNLYTARKTQRQFEKVVEWKFYDYQ